MNPEKEREYIDIAEYYISDMNRTQKEIAKHFNISAMTVINAMRFYINKHIKWDEHELDGERNDEHRYEKLIIKY